MTRKNLLLAIASISLVVGGCDAVERITAPTQRNSAGGSRIIQSFSHSDNESFVVVDFRGNDNILNLRFAPDWDVRRVDISCERYDYTNLWKFAFKDQKNVSVANDKGITDYSRRIHESGRYRCTLTRDDNSPDVVNIRFESNESEDDNVLAGPPPIITGPPGSGGNLAAYSMIGGSALTCTTSTITGGIGVSPGSSITGIPGLCSHFGTIFSSAQAAADQAELALLYSDWLAEPCAPIGANLNGVTLTPGTYCSGALASNLSGTITLDGAGEYLIKFPSTFITSAGSSVNLINGASCADIIWLAESSTTLSGSLIGNAVAFSSITMNPGASLQGRLLARNAAVTITTSTVTNVGC